MNQYYMYKAIILILVFVGILFVTIEVVRVYAGLNKQDPKIEYRYIPRTFEEEQLDAIFPSEIFANLFSQPSAWILSISEYDMKKQEKVNQYFVSQL